MTTQMEFLGQTLDASANLQKAIDALRLGKVVLLLDDYLRENEGDLVVAAEKITPTSMNFLIKKGSGLVCLAMPKTRLDELGLPLMIPENTNFFETAFTVSIEAKTGVTTGVSAQDRAHTVLVAIADQADRSHLARPGHVFPLAAKNDGVFERMGHTEGSVDLMRIAGLKPGAVLCELMNEDGSMPTAEERMRFAETFDIPVISVEEVFFYRLKNQPITIKNSLINSHFGTLSWHSFKLLDREVDIFHKDSFLKNQPARLYNLDCTHLKDRFMAQVLKTSDDALACALASVKDDAADIVIMTSNTSFKRANSELSLQDKALVCRALCELKVKSIISLTLDHELMRIAEHFAINHQKPGKTCL